MWKSILERVTSCKEPHYDNVYICDEWLNFQKFADWFNKKYPYIVENFDFEIDKDLLQLNVKDKIYSPSTCVFLPKRINLFLINRPTKYKNMAWKDSRNESWYSGTPDFNTGKFIRKGFKSQEEAHEFYLKVRAEQAEKAKDYLRSLDYLPEEIIQLVN